MPLLLLIFFFIHALGAAQLKEVRRVLILNELGFWSPGVNAINQEIFAALRKANYHIEVYTEDLDTNLFSDTASQRELHNWYFRKYRDRKPDLILAVGPSPLKFMADSHKLFAPNTPIVFCAITEEFAEPPKLDPEFTGVWGVLQPEKTLDAALQLKPDTKHVVVTGGIAPFDRYLEALVRQRLRSYESRLDFSYLTDLPMPTLLERLKNLPSQTIVYHTSIMQDAAANHFIDATQSVPILASAANAPIFVVDDVDVGEGTIGGDVLSYDLIGQIAADMASRILNGANPQSIPIVRGANIYMFDWRALKRWGLNESNLPLGSVVLNQPPSFWRAFKRYILAGLTLLVVQTLAILALLWQRAMRRKTEAELRDSQSRLEGIVESAMDAVIAVDEEQRIIVFNDAAEKMFRCQAKDAIGSPIDRFIPNGFLAAHGEQIRPFGDTGSTTRSMGFLGALWGLRADGEEFPIEASISQTTAGGKKLFTVIIRDVTERKRAEEALSSVSRKLIEAHEEERTWIARELHDDINQRIALLAVRLESLKLRLPDLQNETSRCIEEIRGHVSDLGTDIQAMSHRLHSSKLDYLGLESASAGFCREVSERQHVEIDFHSENVPKNLSKEISLCLFRVLQEALQNALKHSGSRHFQVSLQGGANGLELTVQDSGAGFDLVRAIGRHGIGLASMQERLKLVDGQLFIDSRAEHGTTIHARVPPARATAKAASG